MWQGPEQLRAEGVISSEAVSSYRALEDEYTLNTLTFERNEANLRQEALQVKTTYDTRKKESPLSVELSCLASIK